MVKTKSSNKAQKDAIKTIKDTFRKHFKKQENVSLLTCQGRENKYIWVREIILRAYNQLLRSFTSLSLQWNMSATSLRNRLASNKQPESFIWAFSKMAQNWSMQFMLTLLQIKILKLLLNSEKATAVVR